MTTNQKLTTNDFQDKLNLKWGDDIYSILTEYKGYRVKTLFRHNVCGSTFEVNPEALMSKSIKNGICKVCFGGCGGKSGKLSEEELVTRLLERYPNKEFEYVSGYINSQTKCLFKHNVCGNTEYLVEPSKLLHVKIRKFCTECTNNMVMSITKFINRIHMLTNGEYKVIGSEYVSNKTPIDILHTKCGNISTVKPNNFLDNYTNYGSCCAYCAGTKLKTHQQYLDLVYVISSNREFEVITKFNGNSKPITVRHIDCGTEKTLKTAKTLFMNATTCDECNPVSMGEYRIRKILLNNNIDFECEVSFDDCVYINKLRFDFYIPEIDLLIEFDGIQHFKESKGFGKLEITQKRDNIKNQWVKDNPKYSLIRIRYDQDIDVIMNIILTGGEIPEDVFFICNY